MPERSDPAAGVRAPARGAALRRRAGEGLPVSRPAVSQHLKALKDGGPGIDRPDGARRIYYIDPHGLGELRRWLDEFWDDALRPSKRSRKAEHSQEELP